MCQTGRTTVTVININPEAILERQLDGGSASERIRFLPKIKKKKRKRYVRLLLA